MHARVDDARLAGDGACRCAGRRTDDHDLQQHDDGSDQRIDALPIDSVGEVPWWPEGERELTLHQALVHVITDLYRHAGHADLGRELIDGAIGADPRWSNLPPGDETWWASYFDRVQAAARDAGGVESG